MGKLALEGAALATGLTAAEPMIAALPEAVRGRVYAGLVIAALLRFTSSALGQLAAFFVREGVTSVDKRADVAATVAEELAAKVDAAQGFSPDLQGNAPTSTPGPGLGEDRSR
jgi:hypothetical protein